MKTTIYKVLFISLFVIYITSCIGLADKQAETKSVLTSFPMPEIPSFISSPEDQTEYIVSHYWDRFDFSDTTLISLADITEQGFVDFVTILPSVSNGQANEAINSMLSKSHIADSIMFSHFTGLADKYLYDPNSPFRNEEYYIAVLDYIMSSPKISETDKLRSIHLFDIAMKNRHGEIASDFKYNIKGGRSGTLSKLKSEYTILFFNNPDCGDCARVKSYLATSPKIVELVSNKDLTILSIYPDEDLKSWMDEEYPESWVNGYDLSQEINSNKLYDLKAIPTLYLLDKDKRVILKDSSVEHIYEWLNKNII